MKRLSILFALLLVATVGFAQSGEEVLGALSQRLGAMGSYCIDFELEMASATATSKGYCQVDGPLYVIAIEGTGEVGGMRQGFDGEKMWMLDGIAKEVAYDNHNPQSHSLFVNPTRAFDFSAELFSVVALEESQKGQWRVTLRPKAGVLDGIDAVSLSVDQGSGLPTRLSYNMAGAEITINILSLRAEKFTSADFEVVVPQGYEVIDFR